MSILLEVIVDAADEQRFREFVSARSPALMRLGFLLTGGDQHAAEDLVQTALAKPVTQVTAGGGVREADHVPAADQPVVCERAARTVQE